MPLLVELKCAAVEASRDTCDAHHGRTLERVAFPPKRDSAELVGLRDRLQSIGRLADDLDVLLRVKIMRKPSRTSVWWSPRVPAPSV